MRIAPMLVALILPTIVLAQTFQMVGDNIIVYADNEKQVSVLETQKASFLAEIDRLNKEIERVDLEIASLQRPIIIPIDNNTEGVNWGE